MENRQRIFHYLFVLAAITLLALLTGVSWNRPWTIVLAGFGLVAQYYVPPLWNRLRFWWLIRRPNRFLERQIEPLRAEIARLKPS